MPRRMRCVEDPITTWTSYNRRCEDWDPKSQANMQNLHDLNASFLILYTEILAVCAENNETQVNICVRKT